MARTSAADLKHVADAIERHLREIRQIIRRPLQGEFSRGQPCCGCCRRAEPQRSLGILHERQKIAVRIAKPRHARALGRNENAGRIQGQARHPLHTEAALNEFA